MATPTVREISIGTSAQTISSASLTPAANSLWIIVGTASSPNNPYTFDWGISGGAESYTARDGTGGTVDLSQSDSFTIGPNDNTWGQYVWTQQFGASPAARTITIDPDDSGTDVFSGLGIVIIEVTGHNTSDPIAQEIADYTLDPPPTSLTNQTTTFGSAPSGDQVYVAIQESNPVAGFATPPTNWSALDTDSTLPYGIQVGNSSTNTATGVTVTRSGGSTFHFGLTLFEFNDAPAAQTISVDVATETHTALSVGFTPGSVSIPVAVAEETHTAIANNFSAGALTLPVPVVDERHRIFSTLNPTVVGFGASVTGGAGQSTFTITTLADSGTGSLRDALSSGSRNIVVDSGLSGTISLLTDITVNGDDWTLDLNGQIVVTGNRILCQAADNWIIKNGIFYKSSGDAIAVQNDSGAANFSFVITQNKFIGPAGDGFIDVTQNYGATVSGSICYNWFEAGDKVGLIDSNGSNEGGDYDISVHNNYFVDCISRQFLCQNGRLHFFQNYWYRYGDYNGTQAAVTSRGVGGVRVEYNAARPRSIGDQVGYNNLITFDPKDRFSERLFGETSAVHYSQNNTLLTGYDGDTTATELQQNEGSIFTPPYSYDTSTPDPELIALEAGPRSGPAEAGAVEFVAGAQTIAVGVSDETHTALAVGFSAGAITISADLAEETHTAISVGFSSGASTIAANVAEETHTALTTGFVPGSISVAADLASETHEALSVNFSAGAQTISVGVAEETHSAISIGFVPGSIDVAVNVSEEVHTALPVVYSSGAVLIAVDVAEETHTAIPVSFISGGLSISVSVAEETHTSQSVDFTPGALSIAADVASEIHDALTTNFTGGNTIGVDVASEIHTALPVAFSGGAISIPVDVASETHTALSVGFSGSLLISAGVAEEVHTALTVGFVSGSSTIQVDVAEESHEALSVGFGAGAISVLALVAEEIHTALSVGFDSALGISVGIAEETHISQPVGFIAGTATISVGVAEETHIALPVITGDPYTFPFSLVIYDQKYTLTIYEGESTIIIKSGHNVTVTKAGSVNVTVPKTSDVVVNK